MLNQLTLLRTVLDKVSKKSQITLRTHRRGQLAGLVPVEIEKATVKDAMKMGGKSISNCFRLLLLRIT
jgi:hypothetical protein